MTEAALSRSSGNDTIVQKQKVGGMPEAHGSHSADPFGEDEEIGLGMPQHQNVDWKKIRQAVRAVAPDEQGR